MLLVNYSSFFVNARRWKCKQRGMQVCSTWGISIEFFIVGNLHLWLEIFHCGPYPSIIMPSSVTLILFNFTEFLKGTYYLRTLQSTRLCCVGVRTSNFIRNETHRRMSMSMCLQFFFIKACSDSQPTAL